MDVLNEFRKIPEKMDFIQSWFKGFEDGITRLKQEQRELLFGECGRTCVQNGVFCMYKQLYEEVQADLDMFFQKLNEFEGVRGEIVEEGSSYNLYFSECTCYLHKTGYVKSPLLCECSRQGVLYAMQALWNDRRFEVTLCGSILRGSEECKLHIKVLGQKKNDIKANSK